MPPFSERRRDAIDRSSMARLEALGMPGCGRLVTM
jgi:hypothetical protein